MMLVDEGIAVLVAEQRAAQAVTPSLVVSTVQETAVEEAIVAPTVPDVQLADRGKAPIDETEDVCIESLLRMHQWCADDEEVAHRVQEELDRESVIRGRPVEFAQVYLMCMDDEELARQVQAEFDKERDMQILEDEKLARMLDQLTRNRLQLWMNSSIT